MRCLVTGTTGFIGKRLAHELDSRGHDVYCLERYVAGRTIYDGRPLKTVFADLNDHFAIQRLIRTLKPEAVFHLAAVSPLSYSFDHPHEILETNFLATVNLAEACMRENSNLKQFLFAGSSEEYGIQTVFPIKETAELKPNSPYSVSKIAADKYLCYLFDAYGFPATVLRNFNTYGRVHSKHFVVENTITQMLQKNTVKLGDSTPTRDFLYVDDHVNSYLACLGKEEAVGNVFNFCTGREVSIKQLVDLIAELSEFTGEIVWNTLPQRPLDIKRLVGDCGKATKTLGWKPTVPLEEGLTRTIRALKANHKGSSSVQ